MDKSLKRGLALLACVGMLFCITFSVLCQAAETAGDVNVDQSVNMKDVLFLRRYLAGLEATLATFTTTGTDIAAETTVSETETASRIP